MEWCGGLVVLHRWATVSGSGRPPPQGWERGGGDAAFRSPGPLGVGEMMGSGASGLECVEGEEAVEVLGPAPEPRAPEPRVPEPEPGLDLSLSPSPLPATPERPSGGGGGGSGPGRRRGGRQVSGGRAPPLLAQRPGLGRSPPAPPFAPRFVFSWRRAPRSAASRCWRAAGPRGRRSWRRRPRGAAWL